MGLKFMLDGAGLAAIAADSAASPVLNGATPFEKGTGKTLVPAAWNAMLLESFSSLSALSTALSSGGVDRGAAGVIYDCEKWPKTPPDEQIGWAASTDQAAGLVHAQQGLLFMATPAANLVSVIDPSQKDLLAGYLSIGLASSANVDIFNIQAQRVITDTSAYSSFVAAAAAQARGANSGVILLAGLSTQPEGQTVTAADILAAIAATRDIVDGHWFNVPQPQFDPGVTEFLPQLAIEVLTSLPQ
jgi:hypothetical protein